MTPNPTRTLELTALCPESEVSRAFMQGMVNRMTVSYFKYGAVADGFPDKVDALASLRQRLERYAESGNLEELIDAANFAMIEFMRPSRSDAHFTATDSDGSPGRTTTTGVVTDAPNAVLSEPNPT